MSNFQDDFTRLYFLYCIIANTLITKINEMVIEYREIIKKKSGYEISITEVIPFTSVVDFTLFTPANNIRKEITNEYNPVLTNVFSKMNSSKNKITKDVHYQLFQNYFIYTTK